MPVITLTILPIRDDVTFREALAVRMAVFVEEQHVPIEEELDTHDANPGAGLTLHLLARVGGHAIGTARLLPAAPGEAPHIGRVAVLPAWRGRGVGRVLMAYLHAVARGRGATGIVISAQLTAMPFYERLGYEAIGPTYLEAGIEHREMRLTFGSRG